MELTNIFSMLGGLALFHLWDTIDSTGLELAAGKDESQFWKIDNKSVF